MDGKETYNKANALFQKILDSVDKIRDANPDLGKFEVFSPMLWGLCLNQVRLEERIEELEKVIPPI